jgi:hypothetical protein
MKRVIRVRGTKASDEEKTDRAATAVYEAIPVVRKAYHATAKARGLVWHTGNSEARKLIGKANELLAEASRLTDKALVAVKK